MRRQNSVYITVSPHSLSDPNMNSYLCMVKWICWNKKKTLIKVIKEDIELFAYVNKKYSALWYFN